ncbi:MAG: agmatinase [Alkalispirochaeta sp.]
MTEQRFLSSEFSQYPPAYAAFHVIPVPFEFSVSYGGGTAGGPAAILAASNQLEVYDGYSTPGEDGIYTHPPVDCSGTPETVFPRITKTVTEALSSGKDDPPVPIVLGGEHSITASAFAAVRRFFGDAEPVGLIQIDAHGDLRDEYEGSPDSHACVVRRIHESCAVPVVQIGVRSLSPEEVIYRGTHGPDAVAPIVAFDAGEIVPAGTVEIPIPSSIPEKVYLTIDVDGLDPSIMPATGTPVPGGLGWYQTLQIIESIQRQRELVAVDIVELAPIPGQHAWEYTAAELVYRVMGIISRGREAQR